MVEPGEAGVSVVIPAYQAAATIAKAVTSCLDDPAVAEVIVVADGPDPALAAAVAEVKADGRVTLIVNPSRKGAPAARNIGLAAATADFVLFLDADDYVEGGLIGALLQAGLRDRADLIFGPFAYQLPDGRRIARDIVATVAKLDGLAVLKGWLGGLFVPCCSVLWRADFVRGIGGWNEAMLQNDDGELVLRACRRRAAIARAVSGVGVYVQRDVGHRVSQQVSAEIFRQQIALLAEIERTLPPDDLKAVTAEIAATYYHWARLAYYNDDIAVGALAEGEAARLGCHGHAGPLRQRLAIRLLGLRRKERLFRLAHRLRRLLAKPGAISSTLRLIGRAA